MENCLLSSLKSSCVGPWLTASKKPLCRKAEEYTRFIQEYEDLIGTTNASRCNQRCPRRCQSVRFRPILETNNIGNSENMPSAWINFYFPSMEVEVLEEQWSYDILEMLGELGGSLGIMLGFSLLSIYDLLDVALSNIRSCRKKRILPNR
ncbi:unnamed protein product [Darwinula stevensoni]|uniref:Uncharacterized protein n=1 Tax=Darwinula stevensoni TaxID=69355 RepID=A0A7R8X558_9CRUS|nr:unnamed protein product [Darwinula stevensoni]CAG0886790.1 unnamed protein product [Darwinula stevensoni]